MNDFDQEWDPCVRLIPIKQIRILNPRERGKRKFAQIIANIVKLGLKRPVTVAELGEEHGEMVYGLACGQGRLETYIAEGEQFIPAIVVRRTREQLMLMSLAENMARRQRSSIELFDKIKDLKSNGYTPAEIAAKTDLGVAYVKAILQLLSRGEEKLLQAVEKGQIPINIAITIATSDDKAIQRALMEAYERNDLRGKSLLRARRLAENRRIRGKGLRNGKTPTAPSKVSADQLLKSYQRDTLRQKLIIQRAKVCETRLLFAATAIKQLFQDENFVTLLRAEELNSLPQYLANLISGEENTL